MHIKHLTLMSGPAGSFTIGTVREIADGEGRALIAGGYAIEVRPHQPETAARGQAETATAAEQEAAKHLANIARTGGKPKARKVVPPVEEPAVPPAPTFDERVAPSEDVSTDAAAE
jgi:hypothetical protein